jgi:hypothetical protein
MDGVFYGRRHIGGITRLHHNCRNNLIDACIGAVGDPVQYVGVDLAGHNISQVGGYFLRLLQHRWAYSSKSQGMNWA